MNSPEISVIVPIYNREKYLNRCIDSILSQSFTDFELILVDDGSKDRSLEICREYEKTDSRIKVIHQENGGVSKARNHGLGFARGKYVTFCDSDDYVNDDWLQCLRDGFETPDVWLSVCGIKVKNEDDRLISISSLDDEIIPCYMFYKLSEKGLLNSANNKLFHADIIRARKVQFVEGKNIAEDLFFVLDYLLCLDEKDIIALHSNAPYNYFHIGNDGSLSNSYAKDYFQCLYDEAHKFAFVAQYFRCTEYDSALDANRIFYKAVTYPLLSIMNHPQFNCFEKIKEIDHMVRSAQFAKLLNEVDLSSFFGKRYLRILKTRNALIIYLYIRLAKAKTRKK